MIQVSANETHISAQQTQACAYPRFSCPDGHQSRPPRVEAPSRQGPQPPGSVTAPAIASSRPGLTSCRGNRYRKENRLLDAAAFGRVFRNAKRSRDPLFTVLWRLNDKALPRLGLAIAKKHCRRATDRNRIKRIIRESFRLHQAELAGIDIVVMNRPDATNADNDKIFDSLERHWSRLAEARPKPQESD